MPELAFDDLLANYIDGDLGEADRETLASSLDRDASAARRFDRALHMEALLRVAHVTFPGRVEISAGVRARLGTRRNWWLPVFAAAAILAVTCGTWAGLREAQPVAHSYNQVLAGVLEVDGRETSEIPNGSRVTVTSASPAIVKLADGSRAELSPQTTALLRGHSDKVRQVVDLEKGKGLFVVEKGARQFRVNTPIGKVMVVGTKFSVELLPCEPKGEHKMKSKLALAMAVAVVAGSVSVEYNGKEHRLTAGQNRVFGAEKEGRDHKEKPKSSLPEGVHGFSGMVRGLVVAKGDKNTFKFKVGKVLKVWKGNKAKRAKALVGQTVKIGPRWEKRDGHWRENELHVLFIRKLKPGHEVNLEIVNQEGDHFSILELAGVQREWAKKGDKHEGDKKDGDKHDGNKHDGDKKDGDKKDGEHREGGLPKGAIGFSGMLRGVVVAKGKKDTCTFKVAKVLKTWKGSRAANAQDLVGLTIKVIARRIKKHGKRRPDYLHVVFIRHILKAGQEVTLEVKHAEDHYFSLLELSADQRESVKKLIRDKHEKGKHEREKHKEKRKEKEKEEEKGDNWDF